MRRTVRISTPIIGVASSMIIACPADMTGDGILDNGDLSAYVSVFLAQGPAADFSNDGIVDNGDISLFIEAYLAGCPTELAIKDTLSDPLNWTGTYALG
ncbi:MAG: GC-type dockerin domain-anchored protein, partial [Phycisphaerales bacterium JB040]